MAESAMRLNISSFAYAYVALNQWSMPVCTDSVVFEWRRWTDGGSKSEIYSV